jgi:drug/metabolite transporter (DMT)-like permease
LSRRPVLYALIFLMVALWSGNFIIGKVALREFPPLLLSGLRVALAGLFIWPVYWWRARGAGERWTRKDLPILVFLGIFGVALNQLFFVLGLSRTTVAHSAIIISTTPVLVLVIAAMVKLEHVTARKSAGMALAIAGVVVLKALEAPGNGAGPTWTGDLCIFLAGVTFALFTVLGKRVTGRHSSVTVNTFAYVGGAVALSPVTLWEASSFSFAQVSTRGWASLAYMALFPSVVCYLIYYYALTQIAASRVSAFSYLQPPLATLLGVLMLGERITAPLVLGGAVIFAGVYLAERG